MDVSIIDCDGLTHYVKSVMTQSLRMYLDGDNDTNSLVRLLDLVKFFLPVLPEIELPLQNLSLDEKIVYTVAAGFIFIFGQLPIYGLAKDAFLQIHDPFFFFRPIFGMEKGTLLELGLLPVITSAFLWQLGAGLRLIDVNFNIRSDREYFQSGQKLTSFVLAVLYGIGFVTTGYYLNVIRGSEFVFGLLPWGSMALIFLQIVLSSFLVTLMVEIFDKGYGFGSGILCFITLQVALSLAKDIVGLEAYVIPNSNRVESVGALFTLLKGIRFNPKLTAANIVHSFTRAQLPNLTQVYIALATILAVGYFQNYRIEIPIRSTKVRGMNNVYPIRLLYTGILPILFAFTVVANLQIFGYFIVYHLKSHAPVASAAIGLWALDPTTLNLHLVSGILYFLSPSSSLAKALLSPLRTVTYAVTILLLSTWFGNKWPSISGSSPKDISRQFKEQGISIAGKRDISVAKELSRIIPVASVSGAFVVAAIALVSDLFGACGRGAAVLVGVSSAFSVLEEFMVEYQQAGGSSQLTNAFRG